MKNSGPTALQLNERSASFLRPPFPCTYVIAMGTQGTSQHIRANGLGPGRGTTGTLSQPSPRAEERGKGRWTWGEDIGGLQQQWRPWHQPFEWGLKSHSWRDWRLRVPHPKPWTSSLSLPPPRAPNPAGTGEQTEARAPACKWKTRKPPSAEQAGLGLRGRAGTQLCVDSWQKGLI